MYVSSHTSARAPSIARISAGKYSVPLRSSPIALPGMKRFIRLAAAPRREFERGGERGVVRHAVAVRRVVNARVDDPEAARVDAIQAEHRQHRREGPRRASLHRLEHLD